MMLFLLLNCIGMYEGAELYETQELSQQKKHPELVSIRKKLAAPNNLLPKAYPRSLPATHILSHAPPHHAQSGQDMLLDDTDTSHQRQQCAKMRTTRRCQSQVGQYQQPIVSHVTFSFVQQDPLSFLKNSLRSIIQYSSQIVFLSRSAFATNLPAHQRRLVSLQKTSSQKLIQERMLTWLANSQHFGTTQYSHELPPTLSLGSLKKWTSEDELIFQDDFEGSNLLTAMRESQMNPSISQQPNKAYLLTLRFDYNTKSYSQWFYFRVRRRDGVLSDSDRFRFKIINMTKRNGFFGRGLKISVCRKGVWGKEGHRIIYYPNSILREESNRQSSGDYSILQPNGHSLCYYTLQFGLEILPGEEIYIAYNQPYTYSRLGLLLDELSSAHQKQTDKSVELKRKTLCTTPLNNPVEVLTFTHLDSIKESNHSQLAKQKPVIVIMGRTHPAETAGSHVMEGILRCIIAIMQGQSDSPLLAKHSLLPALLKQFLIKIIPMVNPDGVILGNSRCNLAGYDLNRVWRKTHNNHCPEVAAIKKHILQYQNRISMFLDLHAHSKKKNVFAYGCHNAKDPFSTREFPYLLSAISPKDFLFSQCRFSTVQQDKTTGRRGKQGTARVFLYKVLNIPNVFTIENSYCSTKQSLFHYDTYKYQKVGSDLLTAIELYFSPTYTHHEKASQNCNEEDDSMTVPLFSSRISQHSKSAHNVPPVHQKMTNHDQIRAKIIQQLHQDDQNISIGLRMGSSDQSQSESQERITMVSRLVPKREAETALEQLRQEPKTAMIRPTSTINRTRSHAPNLKKTQQILNTQSEPQLSNNPKNISRLLRQSKAESQTIEPKNLTSARQSSLSRKMTPLKNRLATQQDEVIQHNRRDNLLTVVDIGAHRALDQPDLRSQLLQRVAAGRSKAIHSYNEHRRNQEERVKQKTPLRISIEGKSTPELDIKDQMRRLIKPRNYLVTLGIREKAERKFRVPRSNKTEMSTFREDEPLSQPPS